MKHPSSLHPDINEFVAKVKQMEKGERLDLSSDEDLSIGIMNLISIEEHLFFTYNKTQNKQHLDLLNQVREMRKAAMRRIVKNEAGEIWCISKHLLAASMRLLEVGTKFLGKGDRPNAEDMLHKSYQLYSLFWGINLGLVKSADVQDLSDGQVKLVSDTSPSQTKTSVSIFAKLGELVQKAIDCCKE
ncbi:hypothetical protein M1523_03260 [Patescibacteria group bacterium]|nr:hypothetical protein [Patescibacteria group bacterium]MCL5091260.1 hypothetical protein [Patescibacteria group bacterium]